MRVLILNSARKFIGEAAHCLDLTRELQKRGHEAQLVVRRGHEVEQRARQAGLSPIAFHFPSKFHPHSDFEDVLALLRIVRLWRPDLIHCHRGKDHWVAAAAKAFWPWSFPPLVRTRHVVVPMAQHFLNAVLFRRFTAQTIAVSQAAAQSLGRIGKQLGPRLHVIYSAVDLETFSPRHRSAALRDEFGVGEDKPLVGLIARIQNVKGQRVFLRAARLVSKLFPESRFLIAGRGSEIKFQSLAQQAKELGIDNRVIFKQWLSDLPAVLASLDVSVIASLGSEGSSRIAYETMASGVPLVATRVGCLPEIIVDRQTGILVPPGDVEALAGGICSILQDRRFAASLARQALDHVRRYHNYDRWINEIIEVYEKALHASHTETQP
ncbi:MAG: glycosyltransferase family 4 protein [Candidatus Sumerlaeaceae bacterium]|jgi:glycosyltransferase involved in cell wall biosynthesis